MTKIIDIRTREPLNVLKFSRGDAILVLPKLLELFQDNPGQRDIYNRLIMLVEQNSGVMLHELILKEKA